MQERKKGVVLAVGALVALVGVLVVALVAYRALAPTQAPEAAGTADVQGTEQDTGKDAGPQLADYDATVYTSLGEPINLTAIANGQPLVINFWATWCPYCIQEMGDYQQLYHLYGDRVAFAFVDCDYTRGETAQKALAWLADNGYADLPAYFDTDQQASTSMGAWSYPTSVVVSGTGEILSIQAGMIDAGAMDSALKSLVA